MNVGENTVFAGALTVILAAAAPIYFAEYVGEKTAPRPTITTTTTSTTSTTTTTTSATTTTLPGAVVEPTTTSTTTTTTSSTTTSTPPYYLQRYGGMGYHRVYMNISYFCRSCVPAVADNLAREPGVKSKSMSWGQTVSWAIYDPDAVRIDRIVELAGGGAVFLNDSEI